MLPGEARGPHPALSPPDGFRLPEKALRNLSLASADGAADPQLSLDESGTPSPTSSAPNVDPSVVDAGCAASTLRGSETVDQRAPVIPRLTVQHNTSPSSEIPATPLALRPEGVLPERRARAVPPPLPLSVTASSPDRGALSAMALRSLRQMDGIGLGVDLPGGTPDATTDTQLCSTPDYFGPNLQGPPRSPVMTPSLDLRAGHRIITASLGPPSPASSAPPSPHVLRSSAFTSDLLRPRTPLTPSHVPGAPAIGAGGPAFEWFSFSPPASPISAR
ncbi:hypothetical protein JCM3774_003348 [Rhodotorula dairenensis]